jgi:HlyD family secretion protein
MDTGDIIAGAIPAHPARCPDPDRGLAAPVRLADSRIPMTARDLPSLPTPGSGLTPASGAAMDRARPSRTGRRGPAMLALLAASVLAAGAGAWWHGRPAPAPVPARLVAVRAGLFRESLALRARVEPSRSVQLDATEGGIVEAVLVHDGDPVAAGMPLYRLQSPEQEQLLIQRGAEVAQQMANVSMARSAQAAALADQRRELAQLEAGEAQAAADEERATALAAAGFVAPAALDAARRQHALARKLLRQAGEDRRVEADIRARSLVEMDHALEGLQRGLRWLEASRDRLLQRAPIAGQVNDFRLQVGASVRAGDHLGRIDDAQAGNRLVADVDEYYLPRLQPGLAASSVFGALRLDHALPQVTDGHVRAFLRWDPGPAPPLRPGQAVDVRLLLGEPERALLLPDEPGVQARMYVREGDELRRRDVRLGRRADGQVEVLAGLRAGDEVLVSSTQTEAERLSLP